VLVTQMYVFMHVLKFHAGQIHMELLDLSGKDVGLQLIQTVFDIIPITRYNLCFADSKIFVARSLYAQNVVDDRFYY